MRCSNFDLDKAALANRDALDAGDVWIESSIYQGKPDMAALRELPQAKLTIEEQAFIDGPVQTLLEMIDDFELQNSQHIPQELLTFLGKQKFFSMIIPKKFGGLEFSPYANSTIVTIIATKSGAIAVGQWADLVALDDDATHLVGRNGDTLLDSWIFAGDDRLVTDVWAAGRHRVQNGQHIAHAAITNAYRKTLARLQDVM